jgi:uncharacterized repeat protein (TIGR03803 family)
MVGRRNVFHHGLLCALLIGMMSCLGGCNDGGAPTFTLSGTVVGLAAGQSVTLEDDAGGVLVVSANGPFGFSVGVMSDTDYAITVANQPSDETCTVVNGDGMAKGPGVIRTTNAANAVVTCSSQAFSLGGTVTGLNGAGLVLANGANTVSIVSGATTFSLPTAVALGSSYSVTVQSQPAGEACAVSNATGTMPAHNVTGVLVSCTDQPFTLGGTISGLGNNSGLTLVNGSSTLNVAAGAATFTMPGKIDYGSPYALTIQSAPAGLTCSVVNGSGTMPAANLSNIAITCSDQAYTVGGTIQGLTASGLVLANGGDQLSVAANSSSFTMPTPVPYTSTYAVTVQTQPAGQVCSVSNGGGTMGTANITNVLISCAAQTYTLSGTISGLTKAGLILANGTSTLQVLANAATFTMPVSVASGAPYNITVPTNPAALNCTVANGSGTVTNADITNVSIDCVGGTETVVHSFGSVANDAQQPQGDNSLIQASDGNLYGMTLYGGAHGEGAVFRLTLAGDETVIYSFTGGVDGAQPFGHLMQANDGNLYGMTSAGGAYGVGVVFKITLSGTLTVLHAFAGGSDGASPQGSLIQATDGNLYGMTFQGGINNGGTIFKIDLSGVEAVLWSFGGANDGQYPYRNLTQASDGNFYGTTFAGGTADDGVVFRYTPGGTESVLYSFQGGDDGGAPDGSLIQASDGDLYGMTTRGGANRTGVVFRVSPTTGEDTTIYAFTEAESNGLGDGSLIQANDGNLYGLTTPPLGPLSEGILFELTLSGVATDLWAFGKTHADGQLCFGSLVQATDGSLYGLTYGGGSTGNGTVFRFN